ncbi:hypothetical protein BTO10_08235 [Vibrio chagasii]|uniref:Uncharacterized protein n=1 Tax=Vibrio chagasii TaxID=170679 RepID=A0A2S7VBF9_9VIBR|nr:hypothetical protein BTO10_08235 [Vibrio chagasii]
MVNKLVAAGDESVVANDLDLLSDVLFSAVTTLTAPSRLNLTPLLVLVPLVLVPLALVPLPLPPPPHAAKPKVMQRDSATFD